MSKNVIGDNFSITINFKWLIQLLAVVATVTYTIYTFKTQIDDMDRKISDNMSELQELIKIHEEESQIKITEMQEALKWYEKELVKVGNVSLNPLSWGKKRN